MARVEVTEGAERGHRDESSRSTGGVTPGAGELADAEHLGPTEVWGPGARPGLDQIGESTSDLAGVDDLEREVRCPNEDRPAQELIEEVVKLCRPLDGPPRTRRLDQPFGFPLRLVVREPAAVDAHDRHVDQVYGAAGVADGVEDVPGAEYLGLACVAARTGGGVNHCVDAAQGRAQPFTGADITAERLHLVAIAVGTACQQPDGVTSLDQERYEPAPEHPGAAGHKYPCHRGDPIRRNAPEAGDGAWATWSGSGLAEERSQVPDQQVWCLHRREVPPFGELGPVLDPVLRIDDAAQQRVGVENGPAGRDA
jgi:hypothetical protein